MHDKWWQPHKDKKKRYRVNLQSKFLKKFSLPTGIGGKKDHCIVLSLLCTSVGGMCTSSCAPRGGQGGGGGGKPFIL